MTFDPRIKRIPPYPIECLRAGLGRRSKQWREFDGVLWRFSRHMLMCARLEDKHTTLEAMRDFIDQLWNRGELVVLRDGADFAVASWDDSRRCYYVPHWTIPSDDTGEEWKHEKRHEN